MTDNPNPFNIIHHQGKTYDKNSHLLELLVNFGNVLKFDNFQEFVDGRLSTYSDQWCYEWPKKAVCKNCSKKFELHPHDLDGAYISGYPFDTKSQFPRIDAYLKAIIECPHCKMLFEYISSSVKGEK